MRLVRHHVRRDLRHGDRTEPLRRVVQLFRRTACTELTRLVLSGTGVRGNIAPLAALTRLTILELQVTGVSGNVAPLSALTELRYLQLFNTGVSGSTALILAATAMMHCGSATMPTGCQ